MNLKKYLEKKYLEDKLTIRQIGKIYGKKYNAIRNCLLKFNIPIRSKSEAHHLSKANHCNLSKKAIEWINGELLGDGGLYSYSSYSASFRYTSKYLEYINYISDVLKSFGIEQSGKIYKYYYKKHGCYTYHYRSHEYEELLPLRKKWYPKGKKIIPQDLKLTPIICRQWYIGDGNLRHRKFGRPHIRLCTCGFLILNIERLIKQFKELGFKATRQSSKNTILISAYSTKNFIKYIGSCPVKCYQYKFNYGAI